MQIRSFVYSSILCCISSATLAQNSKFSGPYAQFGIGYQTASPSFSNTSLSAVGQTLTPTVSVSNASGFTGTVAAGYNFFSGTPLLLGLGIEYTPFPTSNATASASYSGSVGTYQDSASVRVNNSLNIFIAPGLALDQNKLLYGKVGYTGSSANGVNTDFYMGGTSLGFGYKQIISEGFYGFAEYNYVNYGSLNRSLSGNLKTSANVSVPATLNSTVTATSTNLLFGLGYQF
ncbi:outer membrane beta-barrel protein [Polynucleobacter sp.]|uniref:outer membrane protein n=1 Tax=Polynucleobacter sp. TaxID=2029855 RepID=UPI00333E3C38